MAETNISVTFNVPKGIANDYTKVHRWNPELYPNIEHYAYNVFMVQFKRDKAAFDAAVEESKKGSKAK